MNLKTKQTAKLLLRTRGVLKTNKIYGASIKRRVASAFRTTGPFNIRHNQLHFFWLQYHIPRGRNYNKQADRFESVSSNTQDHSPVQIFLRSTFSFPKTIEKKRFR